MNKIILLTNSSKHLDIESGNVEIGKFIDGEISITINEKIEGKEVVVIGSTQSPSDNLVELVLLVDAVVRRGAKKVTVVIPYFGYARSDREVKPNEVACGMTVLKILENVGGQNFDIVTIDLHSQLLKSLFNIPVRDISAIPQLANEFVDFKELAIIAPDKGASKNAIEFARYIQNENIFFLTKKRLSDSKVEITSISGKMGKVAVVVDDMVASGNTIIEASKILKSNGVDNIYVAVTHMVYSAGGWKKLSEFPYIKGVFLTDSICPLINIPSKFRVVSIAPVLKKTIFG